MNLREKILIEQYIKVKRKLRKLEDTEYIERKNEESKILTDIINGLGKFTRLEGEEVKCKESIIEELRRKAEKLKEEYKKANKSKKEKAQYYILEKKLEVIREIIKESTIDIKTIDEIEYEIFLKRLLSKDGCK